ncbi:low molecular weight protein arginine phosphatase [Horticoccus luteus]|uniref:protein-tyrosine-phosphatase n=1 Tax=Horticoccus luteus TaxID=2862869 RepID=A0A8F9TX91_9BACT|nr:low molecular weight protein arginine phosphatase [Horticoccus luteus]QYM79933.1 low molecular weight protein arginine phosphatase [Horticoccus luteus]
MSASGPVIMVCTANICRSPMGEGLLRHALAGQSGPLRSLRVISAGVAARNGELVSEHSVTALRKVGIDIAGHRSQPLTQKLIDEALAVICMSESHRTLIHLQAEPVPPHLHLFREFMPAGSPREIADPYGAPLPVYERCRDEMVEAIPSLVRFLETLVSPARAQ